MPIFCCLISEAYFVGVRFLGAHGADCQIADAQSGDIYEPAIWGLWLVREEGKGNEEALIIMINPYYAS